MCADTTTACGMSSKQNSEKRAGRSTSVSAAGFLRRCVDTPGFMCVCVCACTICMCARMYVIWWMVECVCMKGKWNSELLIGCMPYWGVA